MNNVIRAFLIASAATTVAAVATVTVSRRRRADPPPPPKDPFYVDADALSETERQALRDELERLI